MKQVFAAALIVGMTALSAQADEISDALESALTAYNEGDVQYAIEELDFAKQLLLAKKTGALSDVLPAAPDGWTRTINTDMNAGLPMMGGGVGTEAEYSDGTQSFTVSIMADNPMVAAMGGMVANAALMGAKIERVGRQKFMNQDGELSALVDNRILVQASGADVPVMLDLLGTMDFRALSKFGQ
ncbi:hypothetical protein [Shimia sp. SDUM112013]|uniref:hypothetical protein n=1 Tax=Shimia sp. SDUM112013 TaxID=3136160 RepID=UPI0032EE55BD